MNIINKMEIKIMLVMLVMLVILLTFSVIYIISILGLNWYFKIAYSYNGIWKHLSKTSGDKIITYFPVLNTLAFMVFMVCSGPYRIKINKNK